MTRYRILLFCLFLSQTGWVLAHEIHHAIENIGAVTIRLTYANGQPFAFESFEVRPEGKDIPLQAGRTDAQGRIVFVPGETRFWRIKAFSADGHGVDLRVDTSRVARSYTAAFSIADSPNRASLLLSGFSILLALFASYQLWRRKKL